MNNFFEYLDYRELLKDLFNERKKRESWFSYRWLSKRIDVASTGFISLVLNGKRNISFDLAIRLSKVLKFNKKETGYFLTLVRYNQVISTEEKESAFEELIALRPASARTVQADQQEYYNHWYYSAIRELVSLMAISDNYKEVADSLIPKITVSEAREAIELLERIGFIKRDENGFYYRVESLITAAGSAIEPSVIRKYQGEVMDLAKDALYKIDREERDISTVTLSTNADGLRMIKKRIEQCRSEIMEIAKQSCGPDQIMQFNVQFFPLWKKRSTDQ